MPEVSVIIPNYNHAQYLKQRIDSVIQQTFQNIEVIILDDCSTDNSIEIIEGYRQHPKIAQVVLNKENSGSTFKQWEKGIGLATGKWIWIAESDDWCEKTFLETFVPAFDESKNCSIAFCQTHAIDSVGKIILTTKNAVLEETLAGTVFINSRMLHMNSIFNASMCIFQRKFYYQVSDKFTKYKFCGDWLFWIEIAAEGNVYISAKVLNYFRKHEKDVSSNAFKSGLYYEEYLQLTDDLQEMKIISYNISKKLIKENYRKYYSQKPADKKTKRSLTKRYRIALGPSYYFISIRSFYQKIMNRSFLVWLAIKRRIHLQQ